MQESSVPRDAATELIVLSFVQRKKHYISSRFATMFAKAEVSLFTVTTTKTGSDAYFVLHIVGMSLQRTVPSYSPNLWREPIDFSRRIWWNNDPGGFLTSPCASWSTPRGSFALTCRGRRRQVFQGSRVGQGRHGNGLGIFIVDSAIPLRNIGGS